MTRRVGVRGALLIAVAATSAVVRAQTPVVSQQRFEARAEAVLVDVTVLDERGRPVADLQPGDFTLEVAGRPRPIQSARFVPAGAAAGPAVPRETLAREALTSSNADVGSGRLLLLAVDEGHLRVGAGRAVLRAAEDLLERLAPGDRVGVTRLPDGVGGVEFTTNRALVRDALRAVTGKDVRQQTAERVYLAEADEFVNGTGDRWPQVLTRECPPPDDRLYEGCVASAESSARAIVQDHETRALRTVRYLEQLADRLRPLNTPVQIVLVAEGLFTGIQVRGDIDRLAGRAAAARVSMIVVRPPRELYDIRDGQGSPDAAQDERLMRDGLEQLAGRMRGSLFTATGSGGAVFQRISDELSGYYLLAFEPTDEDRSGRDRRIKVDVRRRGLTVRARPTFAVRETAPAPATKGEQLQQALTSPLPMSGVPIRVATYQATSEANGRVRVLIGAEIGEPTQEAGSLPIGLLVLDRAGKPVVSNIGEVELRPVRSSGPSPRLYLTSVALVPGDYTLRLGVAGPDGLSGSVHHSFTARLRPAAGASFSDIIVAAASGAESPRPIPSAVVDGDRLMLMLEGEHPDPKALESVKVAFEILQSGRGAPIASLPTESEARANGTQRAFASAVRLDALPPGEYVARARIEAAGRPSASFDRLFRVERTAKPGGGAANAAPAAAIVRSPVTPLPARIAIPMARFTADQVLRPDIVNGFLDYLQTKHQPSDAVRSLVDQARKGTFGTRAVTAGSPDDVVVSFIGGLAALRQGQMPQATALFQRTLRGAPDFVGIAFFLAATHAASGRDREAAGAWQMSLLSREAEPAYPFLVDALLRVGEAQRALDLMERAPEAWKSSREKQDRETLAEAQAGRYTQALPKLTAMIAERPADLNLLFVGIQALYRRHLQEPMQAEELKQFDAWTRRYLDAPGPERVFVTEWRAQVLP